MKNKCKPLFFIKFIKKLYLKEFHKEMSVTIDSSSIFSNSLEQAIYEIIIKNKDTYIDRTYNIKTLDTLVLNFVNFYIELFPNLNESLNNLKIDDIIILLKSMYISQSNSFVLIRYDEKQIWNNPYIVGKNKHWEMYEGILKECRSIILDLKTEEIVSLPFDKFLNLNEDVEYSYENIKKRIEFAKKIEYSNKLDGDFFQITKYKDEFIYSSSSSLVQTNVRVWMKESLDENLNIYKLSNDYPNDTCMFEWINKKDRKIVSYDESKDGFYLIGMRNKISGKLKPYSELIKIAKKYNLSHTTIFDIKNLDECISICEKIKGKNQEGFVLNIDDFLIKIKGTDYCDIMLLLKNNSSFNVVIRKYVSNELDDVLSNIPIQHRNMIEEDVKLIKEYEYQMSELLEYYYSRIPNGTNKEVFNWIKVNIPFIIRKYVIKKMKYDENTINFLSNNQQSNMPSFLIKKDIVENLKIIQKIKKTL